MNYNGALDFGDGEDTDCEYRYDSDGALTYDGNGGITGITYDDRHHPSKIIMSAKKYITNNYTPGGRKLSSHHVAFIPNGNGTNRLDRVNGLNMYDFGARWYDVAGVPMWTSVDPLAEKYYHISPYAYCGGDPVNFVDPDGRTVKIYYKNSDGDSYVYNFNGKTKQFSDPFVQDFIDTYWFFKETGGGENVIDAVEDTNTIIYVSNAEEENGGTYFDIEEREFTVHWESRKGLFLSNGGKQSPATRLEHEFDHAMSRKNDAYSHRIRQSKKDEIYENEEEKRVIQGSESKTAKKHHEGVRYDHKGKTYDTEGPTTTKRKIK